jgi:hypothetical protein
MVKWFCCAWNCPKLDDCPNGKICIDFEAMNGYSENSSLIIENAVDIDARTQNIYFLSRH